MRMIRRLAVAGCGAALALGGLTAVAPAASATPQSCFYYLLQNQPGVDLPTAEAACTAGGTGTDTAFSDCYAVLSSQYVPAVSAVEACLAAQD